QPDCNLPGLENLHQQISLGRAWFEQHLGFFPRIGYNVDSFGHSAALPDLLAAHGQPHYVFMRPMAHETPLPANVFRWRGRPGGKTVNAFRISCGYATIFPPTLELVERALAPLPNGVTHTMCFLGVGDHGGGPNEHMIQWVRDHQHALPGVRLEFSSPERFFRALAPQLRHLPLVTGELQMHAIGCYTGHRPVKLGVRRTENLLALAQRALATAPAAARRAAQPALAEAWRTLCFNSFHDTLGGSCTPSAARAPRDVPPPGPRAPRRPPPADRPRQLCRRAVPRLLRARAVARVDPLAARLVPARRAQPPRAAPAGRARDPPARHHAGAVSRDDRRRRLPHLPPRAPARRRGRPDPGARPRLHAVHRAQRQRHAADRRGRVPLPAARAAAGRGLVRHLVARPPRCTWSPVRSARRGACTAPSARAGSAPTGAATPATTATSSACA
ncbi:MAG: hypothetical protein NT173_15480, partial [Opitutales bacterium]|nr:hypothetical protein [Opitutales bacterium]